LSAPIYDGNLFRAWLNDFQNVFVVVVVVCVFAAAFEQLHSAFLTLTHVIWCMQKERKADKLSCIASSTCFVDDKQTNKQASKQFATYGAKKVFRSQAKNVSFSNISLQVICK